ncbi:sulfotransferase family protein [Marinomonas pollencensis]|uniref:Sulfotransferase family protein n=1 Tax=Marinomonas pollencensis TaxID=491954 RepID=A0A3E0D6Q0_9GAMM|nr:sulfotransferase [Marinomonas pollencensis]REG78349.1 sulfotransferase family protein [Marinomonas pollencensis]
MKKAQEISNESPVVVLGMHRSGSSAITEMLTLFDLYFGKEEDSIGSSSQNSRGFWERRDVRDVNDKILFSAHCDWDTISNFNLELMEGVTQDGIVDQIKKLDSQLQAFTESEGKKSYLLKEPRMCLTFPLWERSFKNKSAVIFIHRNPLEVAASLNKRNDFDEGYSLTLWYNYVLHALKNLKGKRVLFISYEQLNANPVSVSEKIHAFLLSENILSSMPDRNRISDIIQGDLRHQKQSIDFLPNRYKELNDVVESFCAKDDASIIDDFSYFEFIEADKETEWNIIFNKYLNFKKEYINTESYVHKLKLDKKILTEQVVSKNKEISSYKNDLFVKFYVKIKNILK